MLTQTPPQSVKPGGHIIASVPLSVIDAPHRPLMHRMPAEHALPQPPQLFASVATSAQMSPQSTRPGGHIIVAPPSVDVVSHTPSTQRRPVGQALLHMPQWRGLSRRLTQPAPQSASPATPSQAVLASKPARHAPPMHICPEAHARPQPPQWLVLLEGSTQPPPQTICPDEQDGPSNGGVPSVGGGASVVASVGGATSIIASVGGAPSVATSLGGAPSAITSSGVAPSGVAEQLPATQR